MPRATNRPSFRMQLLLQQLKQSLVTTKVASDISAADIIMKNKLLQILNSPILINKLKEELCKNEDPHYAIDVTLDSAEDKSSEQQAAKLKHTHFMANAATMNFTNKSGSSVNADWVAEATLVFKKVNNPLPGQGDVRLHKPGFLTEDVYQVEIQSRGKGNLLLANSLLFASKYEALILACNCKDTDILIEYDQLYPSNPHYLRLKIDKDGYTTIYKE